MSLVVLEQISLSLGGKTLIDQLNLRIDQQDRIGLVGPNGSGKSSLLRLLARQQGADSGRLNVRKNLRLGFLAQDLNIVEHPPLIEFVRQSVPGRAELDQQLATAEAALEQCQHTACSEEELMDAAETLASIHEQILHFEEHFSEHEALRILAGLGFKSEDRLRNLSTFSGGWQMRAVLASLLFQRPDLLLLDEPTNHLDMPSVAWLSGFFKRYAQAFILVCHDREFLNEQVSRIVSFEPEGICQYSGNYEQYQHFRSEQEVILVNQAKNQQRKREQTEQFISRFRAKASKARSVQSKIKALDKLEQVQTFEQRKVMRFEFPACVRSGDIVLKTTNLGQRYGEHTVFSHAQLYVGRGEKIAITGVNGAGKTTLLKLLAGELSPSEGSIQYGHHVEIGYFAQHHEELLPPDQSLYNFIAQQNPSAGATRIRSILGALLFREDDVDKKIAVLSGGERARISLARLLIKPGNLLLMDEPTNHLDLESSESLVASLKTFDGTLIFVSHNRSFVRQLATKIWNVENGHVEEYPGTLDEYLERTQKLRDLSYEQSENSAEKAILSAKQAREKRVERPKSSQENRHKQARLGQKIRGQEIRAQLRPLQKRVKDIEEQIAEMEQRQQILTDALSRPDLDSTKRVEMQKEYQQNQQTLGQKNQEWEMAMANLEEAKAAF